MNCNTIVLQTNDDELIQTYQRHFFFEILKKFRKKFIRFVLFVFYAFMIKIRDFRYKN